MCLPAERARDSRSAEFEPTTADSDLRETPSGGSIGEILAGDAKDSDKLKTAQIVLDRVGLGPHSSQDLSVGLSLVEQWMDELDALGDQGTLDSDSA